jgi:hypothetical protein
MTALAAASPLADDWEFTQISDTVETNYSRQNVNLNGYSVTCKNGTPHGGDPTVGWKSTASTATSHLLHLGLSGSGSLEVKDLHAQFTAVSSGNPFLVFSAGPDVLVHDIIATNTIGSGDAVHVEMSTNSPSTNIHIWNIASNGFYYGVNQYLGYTASYVIENITAINTGGGFSVNLNGTTGTALVQNCCCDPGFGGGGIGTCTGNNNASTNTSANNFGSGTGNEVSINDGGGVCFDGGIAATISGNTAGIRGTQRPQSNGDKSIGADEFPSAPGPSGGGGSGSGGGGISGAITAAMAAGY